MDLQEELFKAEEKLLDLKFDKENFDLQYARLQKRISDLEQYKLHSSKYSAVLKNNEEQELNKIEDLNQDSIKKRTESNKIRNKSTRSVAELEMVIESMKRVVEKQKTENDNLSTKLEQTGKYQDKVKSEKQLRQRIEQLEQALHSYEMKDINMDEKDKTIKKMLEQNRMLRDDLRREIERYDMLEQKYKDMLVKFDILSKDNTKNEQMAFSSLTGTNIKNH